MTLSISRSFLIVSLLGLSANVLCAFQQAAVKKTKYEFTDTRVSKADTLLKDKKYDLALEAYQNAYDLFEKEGFYEGMVYVKERMGRAYRFMGKDSLSRVTYTAASALSREALGPNHILESKAYLNNGIRAHFQGQFTSASGYLDSAAWYYEKANNYDSVLLKDILSFKFYTYFYSGLSNDTLVKYLDLKSAFYESQNSTTEERIYLLSDYNRAFFKIGDFPKSIAYGLEAVKLAETELDSIDAFYYTDALFNLGRSLHAQDELDQALSVATKLIEYSEKTNPDTRDFPAYLNLKAVILNGMNRFEEASKEFRYIIDFLESRSISNPFYRSAIMNLGVSHQKMQEYEIAEKYLKEALVLEKNALSISEESLISKYSYLGQLYKAWGKNLMAAKYYDSAARNAVVHYDGQLLDYPPKLGLNPTYETLSILRNKQISMEKSFQSNDSLEYLFAAINYAEQTHNQLMGNRENLQATSGKLLLSKDFKDLYESALNSLFNLYEREENQNEVNFISQAFDFMARSKSNLFLEQSGEFGAVKQGELSESVTEEYYELRSQISRLEKAFYNLSDEIATSDSIRAINGLLMNLNSNLSGLLQEIRKSGDDSNLNRDYFNELMQILKDDLSRAYIEFFVGEEYTFIILMNGQHLEFKRIKLDKDFLSKFNELIKVISTKPELTDYSSKLNDYQQLSYTVYKGLFGDILEQVPDVSKLTITPDEFLARLPFEVLINRIDSASRYYFDLDFLIKQYVINYSLSSIELCQPQSKRVAPKEILGIGYSGDLITDTRSSSMGALPGTQKEIEFLQSSLNNGDFRFGESGSKQFFLQQARNYDILHLAVHGIGDSTNRYESSLIFNGLEDNVLETSDLYAANLNARLAILSACESGVGQINKGEGTFSIARSFSLVGVPSTVMSLWMVNDEIASKLMVGLHSNLIAGQKVSNALTNSKVQFLEEGSGQFTSHPYYWSAFVSLGEDVEMKEKSFFKSRLFILLITFALLIITAILIYKKKRGN